jgi:hypothetical protein
VTDISVVLAELDRIAALPVVAQDSGRADSFDCGVRWALRMVREAVERGAPAPPVVREQPLLEVIQTTH